MILRFQGSGRWGLAIVALATVGAVAVPPQDKMAAPMKIRLVDAAPAAGITLKNISGGPRKDYLLEVAGAGAAWMDYNNDGRLDLLVVNGSTVEKLARGGDLLAALYRNDGNGRFTDVTAPAGLSKTAWGMGVCVADYDNDGYDDAYITAYGNDALYRNLGDGSFRDVAEKAGIREPGWSTGCAFGDYDRDGDVDLYVANYVAMDVHKTPTRGVNSFCQYMGMNVLCGPRGLPGGADHLYRNNGNGSFTDVSEPAGIRDPGHYGFGVLFTDFDDDGWPDIYVANDSTPNFLFHNQHNGTFKEIALEAGAAFSEEGRAQAGMGVDAGDYDNDGDLDIFVTNFSQDTNTLYRNNGDSTFTVETYPAGLGESSIPYMAWGTGLVDFDNDGWLDIFIANGHIYPEIDRYPLGSTYLEKRQLYQNRGNGRFLEVTQQVGGELLVEKSSRAAAFADYDDDGDVDVFLTNVDDRPTLLRNDGGNANHWLQLRLTGTKSNRNAIGARVTVHSAGWRQTAEVRSGGSYDSHNDFRLHFGLGRQTHVSRIEVRWPSGAMQAFETLPVDKQYLLKEGQQPVAVRPARK